MILCPIWLTNDKQTVENFGHVLVNNLKLKVCIPCTQFNNMNRQEKHRVAIKVLFYLIIIIIMQTIINWIE